MNSDTKTKAQPQDSEETEAETDKARFEKDYILETGSVLRLTVSLSPVRSVHYLPLPPFTVP